MSAESGRADATGADVGGLALRAVLAGAVVTAVALLVLADPQGRVSAWSVLGGVVLLAATAAAPGSVATTLALVVIGVLVLDSDPGLLLLPVAAMAHLVHVVAALAALGPVRARFELAALAPTARRWLVAEAVALPVLAVAVLAPGW